VRAKVRWLAAAKADGITLKCSKRDLAVPGRRREIDRLFGFSSYIFSSAADVQLDMMMAAKGREDENNVFFFRGEGVHVRVWATSPPPPPPRIVLTK